jgi:hypothetical protein
MMVHVVGHQAPSPNLHRRRSMMMRQKITIKSVIHITEKHLLTAIATLCDMVWNIRNNDSNKSGHIMTVLQERQDVNLVDCHRNSVFMGGPLKRFLGDRLAVNCRQQKGAIIQD